MKRGPEARLFLAVLLFFFASCLSLSVRAASQFDKSLLESLLESLFNKKLIRVQSVEVLAEDLQIFGSQKLIRIYFSWDPEVDSSVRLQHWLLHSGGPVGIFAFDGKQLLYLGKNKKKLETVFNISKVCPRSVDPMIMARIISLTQIDYGNNYCRVLSTPSELTSKKGYEIDQNKWKKIQKEITPPAWDDSIDSQMLTYYCVWGWEHKLKDIRKVRVNIVGGDSRIKIDDHIVAADIFTKTPVIEY